MYAIVIDTKEPHVVRFEHTRIAERKLYQTMYNKCGNYKICLSFFSYFYEILSIIFDLKSQQY